VNLEPAAPSVPGYYWQHIAYVVIWWLMALVVLFLPVYGRWREREQ
jgi:Mg2+ and Co2+ transporter CorA